MSNGFLNPPGSQIQGLRRLKKPGISYISDGVKHEILPFVARGDCLINSKWRWVSGMYGLKSY